MPTTAQIAAKSVTVLTALEAERVREILGFAGSGGESAEVTALVDTLTEPQRQVVRAYIEVWDNIGDDTARLAGGRDGLDSDVERDRELVRRRLRNLFNLPEIAGVGTLDRSQMIGAFRVRGRGWTGGTSEV